MAEGDFLISPDNVVEGSTFSRLTESFRKQREIQSISKIERYQNLAALGQLKLSLQIWLLQQQWPASLVASLDMEWSEEDGVKALFPGNTENLVSLLEYEGKEEIDGPPVAKIVGAIHKWLNLNIIRVEQVNAEVMTQDDVSLIEATLGS